jgi:hypothetical protein
MDLAWGFGDSHISFESPEFEIHRIVIPDMAGRAANHILPVIGRMVFGECGIALHERDLHPFDRFGGRVCNGPVNENGGVRVIVIETSSSSALKEELRFG